MAERCQTPRKDGSPCTAPALASGHCWAHDPSRAEERRAVRARGGQQSSRNARAAKHLPAHLAEQQTTLIELINEVRSGEIAARSAEVIGALVGRLLDLARYAHEIGEGKELEARLAALEEQLTATKGGRR